MSLLRDTESWLQALKTTALMPVLVLLGGCFFETPPNVNVTGMHVLAVGASDSPSVKLGVDIQLQNPTDEPIQLEVYDYTVRVNAEGERSQWSGTWSALRTLPPGKTVDMSIPAVVPYNFSEAPEKAEWRVSGSISYKAPGRLAQILFDTGFRRPEHQFNGRGVSITPPNPASDTE